MLMMVMTPSKARGTGGLLSPPWEHTQPFWQGRQKDNISNLFFLTYHNIFLLYHTWSLPTLKQAFK